MGSIKVADRIVCLCNSVTEKEILSFLKRGANSTAEIQRLTGAGTSCGRCLPVIDNMVSTYKNKKPKEQQTKLNLGF